MAVIDSRVKRGILKFTAAAGGAAEEDFSCQIRAVSIDPSAGDAGDNEEVLCGDIVAGTAGTTDDKLTFTLISDWGAAKGYQAFSWLHRGETVAFVVQFDASPANLWSGTVVMDATTVGGAVNEKVTIDVSLKIVTVTPPAAFGDGGLHPLSYSGGPVTHVTKGAAVDGDAFPSEPTVTASDAANAAKLTALGFIAGSQAAWATGEQISVGGFAFHWDGSAWAEGAVS